MNMFRHGGTEMKKVCFFIVVWADVLWLTIALIYHPTAFWFLSFALLQCLVGGPYFASKCFSFLTAFVSKPHDPN